MSDSENSESKLADVTEQAWLDKTISKAISRKLTVFIIGTIFFGLGWGLEAADWMTLAIAYVGTQGFIDAVVAFRNSGR